MGYPGRSLLPYRLPELLEAIAAQKTVFVLEGEKDVDAACALGIPATCNAGGAKKWRTEHAGYLQDADVVVVPDNDAAGHDHAHSVAISLAGIARRVRFLELPGLSDKGDFSDWLATGKTAEQFWSLVETARDYGEPGRADVGVGCELRWPTGSTSRMACARFGPREEHDHA